MLQVMAMDGLSKNVFLIGVLHIVGYAVFSLQPIAQTIHMVFFPDYYSDEWVSHQLINNLSDVGCFILMQVLAGLMLRGVVKKRYALLAPFLIINSLVLGSRIVMAVVPFLITKQHLFDYFAEYLYNIGLNIMTLYPVYTLFSKLRSQAEKEKSVQVIISEHEKTSQDLLKNKLDV